MQNSGGGFGKMGYESTNQMADVGDKIRKCIQEIASASVASNEKAAEFAANVSEESKAKDAQFQAKQRTATAAATVAQAAVMQAAAAAAAAEEASARSNSQVKWEHTAQRMAIILLAQTTPAQHAPTNAKATTISQPPTTVSAAAISGRDYPRSRHPSRTT